MDGADGDDDDHGSGAREAGAYRLLCRRTNEHRTTASVALLPPVVILLLLLLSAPPAVAVCRGPGQLVLSNANGNISLQGSDYQNSIECQWLIAANSPGKFINIEFIWLNTECSSDFLYVYDGSSINSKHLLGAYSGSTLPANVYAASGNALLFFRSNGKYVPPSGGFQLTYSITSCALDCSGNGQCIGGYCLCSSAYSGFLCNIQQCASSVDCNNHGSCNAASSGQFLCACDPPYVGWDCSLSLDTDLVPSQWTVLSPAGSGLVGKAGHGVAYHAPTNCLYMFGGRTMASYLDSLLAYNLSSNTWVQLLRQPSSAWPAPRHGHRMLLAPSGILYVHGGLTVGDVPTAELWSYNLKAGLWAELATSPVAVSGHTLTLVNASLLYAFGGLSAGGALLSDIQVFNITQGTWTALQPRGGSGGLTGGAGPRLAGHSAVYHAVSDSLLVYGGHSPYTASATQLGGHLYAFHLKELYWSELAYSKSSTSSSYVAPGQVAYHSAVLMGNYMVVYGGQRASVSGDMTCYGCSSTDDVYAYHLGCHRWVALPSLEAAAHGVISQKSVVTGATGRYSHAAVLVHNNILLISGGFAGSMLSDVIAYKVPLAVSAGAKIGQQSQTSVCGTYSNTTGCTADPECMWCQLGSSSSNSPGSLGSCMSRLNATMCRGTPTSSFCPGVCIALQDCGSCAVQGRGPLTASPSGLVQSEQCMWCTKEMSCQPTSALSGTCLSATATVSGYVGWWGGLSELAASLKQCLAMGPPAGLYWALYSPPQNYDLPDQVFFSSAAGIMVYTGSALTSCCFVLKSSGTVYTLGRPSLLSMYLTSWGANSSFKLSVNSDFRLLETVASTVSSQQTYINAHRTSGALLPNVSSTAAYAMQLTAVTWPAATRYGAAVYWQLPTKLSLLTYEHVQPYQGGNCSSHVTCLACLLDTGCVWCDSAGTYQDSCLTKGADVRCPVESGLSQLWPLIAPEQCITCDSYVDCASCVLNAGCSWDSSNLACLRKGLVSRALTSSLMCPQSCNMYTNSSSCLQSASGCSWCYITLHIGGSSSSSSSSSTGSLDVGCGFCLPLWSILLVNEYGQCQPLLTGPNQTSTIPTNSTSCRSCALATTCNTCLSRASCGWCSSDHNPLIGACTPITFHGTSLANCTEVVLSAAMSQNVTLPSNWTAAWSYLQCPIVNKCLLGLDDCLVDAICVNTTDSFYCQCQQGFTGDGHTYCDRTCSETCVNGVCSGAPSFVCLCQLGWTGANCSVDCGCNYHSTCGRSGVGFCDQCFNHTAGLNCELCEAGTYRNTTQPGGCSVCECNGHGDSASGICNATTGVCYCRDSTKGAHCDVCESGYYGDPRDGGTCFAECFGRLARTGLNGSGSVGSYRRRGGQDFCIWTLTVFPDFSSNPNRSQVPTISIDIVGLSSQCSNEYVYVFDGLLPTISPGNYAFSGYKVAVCGAVGGRASMAISSGYATIYFDANLNTTSGFNATYTVNSCPDECSGPRRYCDMSNNCLCSPSYGGNDCQAAICPGNCSGNGSCLADGSCACFQGHAGASCSEYVGLPFWIQPLFSGDVVATASYEKLVPAARSGHTAVSCDGGQNVLLFGGRSAERDLLGDLWLYDVSARQWSKPALSAAGGTPTAPGPRFHHAAACLRGAAVMAVYGGLIQSPGGSKLVASNDTWLLDLRNMSWTRLQASGSTPAVGGHTLTVLNGTDLLLLGGYEEVAGYHRGASVLHVTSSTSAQWTRVNPSGVVPPGLLLHTAVYVRAQNVVYVHGGYASNGASKINQTSYVLDIDHMQWNVVPPAETAETPQNRYSHLAADVAGSYMIVLGGLNDKSTYDDTIFAYSYRCNQWYNVTSALVKDKALAAVAHAAVAVDSGGVLVVGSVGAPASASVTLVHVPSDLCLLVNECRTPPLVSLSTSDVCSSCPSVVNVTANSVACAGLSNASAGSSCSTNKTAGQAVTCSVNGSTASAGCSLDANAVVATGFKEFPQCNSSLMALSRCDIYSTCTTCLTSWLPYGLSALNCQWCGTSRGGQGFCIPASQPCATMSSSYGGTASSFLSSSWECPDATCQSPSVASSICTGCLSATGCAWVEEPQQQRQQQAMPSPGWEVGWTCKNQSLIDQALLHVTSSGSCPAKCMDLATCHECAGAVGAGESLNEGVGCYWSTAYAQCLSDADVVLQCSDGRCGRLAARTIDCLAAAACAALTTCSSCMAQPWCGWCSIDNATTAIDTNGRGMCLNASTGAAMCNGSGSVWNDYLNSIFQNQAIFTNVSGNASKYIFSVSWNMFQCPAENECLNGHNDCDPVTELQCVDTALSFDCTCRSGYNQSFDGSSCDPICNQGCGNGHCVAPNTCSCDFGFVGNNCSVKCMCNGHGQCSSVDALTNCSYCRDNTTGDQCQLCLPNFVGSASSGNCTPCYEICRGRTTICHSISNQTLLMHYGPTSADDTVCVSCSSYSFGRQCESCVDGYFRLHDGDPCQPCPCNGRGSTCNPLSGSGCQCYNNTQSPCTDEENCYLQQCSICADSYIGAPVGQQQCYLAMSASATYCLSPQSPTNCSVTTNVESVASTLASELNETALLYGQGLLFASRPIYVNVDLKVFMDIYEGGVDFYVTKQSDLLLLKNDPVTGWLSVDFGKSYRIIANSTRSKRDSLTGSTDLNLVQVFASEINYVTITESRFLLFVKNVTRRLVITFPESAHNLSEDKFYILVIGRSQGNLGSSGSSAETGSSAGSRGRLFFCQDQAHLDPFVFVCVFVSCFLTLLVLCLVSWLIRLCAEQRRQLAERATRLVKMAARPYSTVVISIPNDLAESSGICGEEHLLQVNPVAMEPLEDGLSAVTTVVLRLPSVSHIAGFLWMASALTTVKRNQTKPKTIAPTDVTAATTAFDTTIPNAIATTSRSSVPAAAPSAPPLGALAETSALSTTST